MFAGLRDLLKRLLGRAEKNVGRNVLSNRKGVEPELQSPNTSFGKRGQGRDAKRPRRKHRS